MDRFDRPAEQDPEAVPDVGPFLSEYLEVLQSYAFWLVAPGAILTVLYWAVFLRWKGATPGKLMLRMRIRLRDQPGQLPWSSIGLRMALQFGVAWTVYYLAFASGSAALYFLSMLVVLVTLLDPLWATWDSRRQTLHDKLAATHVVRSR